MKKLTEIKINDLLYSPVWYFPGEDEEGYEFSIKPATQEIVQKGFGIIVKTIFTSLNNKTYIGFIHHQAPYSLDALQPTVIFENNYILYFWKGMFLPDEKNFKMIKQKTPPKFYPTKYKSVEVFGLKSYEGVLEGLYYFDEKEKIQVKRY